jgi:2-C-methyl-D-erythritol 4-phosphate cytidylyltransferase
VVHSIDGLNINNIPNRAEAYIAKAPQSFYYGKILTAYDKASVDNVKTVDSAMLCNIYNIPMHIVESTKNNIKISNSTDFYMFRALYEANENQQIFGV